jgi:hypothetical protein
MNRSTVAIKRELDGVPCHKQFVAGFCGHVAFVVAKVAVRPVFIQVLRILSVRIHEWPMLSHVTSGRWSVGPLAVLHPHRRSLTPS